MIYKVIAITDPSVELGISRAPDIISKREELGLPKDPTNIVENTDGSRIITTEITTEPVATAWADFLRPRPEIASVEITQES
jgi:hypothetical protein